MFQNPRVAAFTVSDLLRKSQKLGKITAPIGLKSKILQMK